MTAVQARQATVGTRSHVRSHGAALAATMIVAAVVGLVMVNNALLDRSGTTGVAPVPARELVWKPPVPGEVRMVPGNGEPIIVPLQRDGYRYPVPGEVRMGFGNADPIIIPVHRDGYRTPVPGEVRMGFGNADPIIVPLDRSGYVPPVRGEVRMGPGNTPPIFG